MNLKIKQKWNYFDFNEIHTRSATNFNENVYILKRSFANYSSLMKDMIKKSFI